MSMSVLLPEPDGPTMATTAPSLMVRSIPWSTGSYPIGMFWSQYQAELFYSSVWRPLSTGMIVPNSLK